MSSSVHQVMSLQGNLVRACRKGKVSVVEALLADKRVDPRLDESKALRVASKRGHREIVRLLLKDRRADPTAKRSEALFNAAAYWNGPVVKLLLDDGRADPKADDYRAVFATQGDPLVKLFLEDSRVKIDEIGTRLLAMVKDPEIVKTLLANKHVDPTANNSVALGRACIYGQVEKARLLLQDGRAWPDNIHELYRWTRDPKIRLLLQRSGFIRG